MWQEVEWAILYNIATLSTCIVIQTDVLLIQADQPNAQRFCSHLHNYTSERRLAAGFIGLHKGGKDYIKD